MKPSNSTTTTNDQILQKVPQQCPPSQQYQPQPRRPATFDEVDVGTSKPSSVEWIPVVYKKKLNPATPYANLVKMEYTMGIDRREEYGMQRDDERIWRWLEGVPADVKCCVEEI